MAVITGFERNAAKKPVAHRTHVVGKWSVARAGGATLLQVDTYGSADRQNPESISQTFQLDRRAAEQLVAILRSEFGLS